MNKLLSQYFSSNRRYSRSVNLERDLERVEALEGYILTERSLDALHRILGSLHSTDGNRAWTITSVYGTGKSAFAHFLTSLLAKEESPLKQVSLKIAQEVSREGLDQKIPQQEFLRAVVTAQREPIAHTVIRALAKGAETFWERNRRKSKIVSQLLELNKDITSGKTIKTSNIPQLAQDLARAAGTGIFLIIDELGKNLEYAVYNEGAEDLYLLQQLAELPRNPDSPVYLLGILHQSFADYGNRLATVQKNEWAKIQGRFEDIPFTDSPQQMMRLIGEAICQKKSEELAKKIAKQTRSWSVVLGDFLGDKSATDFESVYPLHPLTALVLPSLCIQYAQSDRSLFTFLTSAEPYSFRDFLNKVTFQDGTLPTLKLDWIYDYFVESVGMGMSTKPNQSRWIEIQGLIADAKHLGLDSLRVLKTIGILNLITTTGILRATRQLVCLALCDTPNSSEAEHWEQIINDLLKRNVITHFKTLDELRIWQGSDFNVDAEVQAYREQERTPLATLLSQMYPLKPLVAQRHSYRTGTLRYFERHYLDASQDLQELHCRNNSSDGLIGYWLDEEFPEQVPTSTVEGKPLIILGTPKLGTLRLHTLEFSALQQIANNAPQLQTDAVARREVKYRLGHSRRLLEESLALTFGFAGEEPLCWVQGRPEIIKSVTGFNARLSQVCDRVYYRSPILWNELINRRELSSQGAMARRQLIEAMLEHEDRERLGLDGYGPEVSMYYSVLAESEIHRQEEGQWGFYPPPEHSRLYSVWYEIESFCKSAIESPKTLDRLYHILADSRVGIGMKQGAIPVLLVAVLLYHIDDIGVYMEGTFVPVLGSEHLELLVKEPARFGVKYFEVVGLRSQVFKELEAVLRNPDAKIPQGVRNTTLLMVVKPLFQFVKKLPNYTLQTQRLSPEALAVRKALRNAQEPDELLFHALPQACGLTPIGTGEAEDSTIAKTLRKKLVQALHELQTAYDRLLSECKDLLHEAFGVRSSEN